MPSRTPSEPPTPASRGAVLAGGKSSRMGEPKAGAMLAARPLIAYPIEAIRAAGLQPVVVAKRDSPLPEVGCPVIRDGDATTHPAAGVLAALRSGDGSPVVAIACDMPFVEPQLLAFLAGLDTAAAVPRVRGRLEPLLARYSADAIPVLESAIAHGRALHEAIEALDPLIVDDVDLARFGEPERLTRNVNDAAELAAAERLLAAGATR